MCAPSCSSRRTQAHHPPALGTVLASALEAPGRWSDSCGVGAHSRGSEDPRVRVWSGGENQVLPYSRPVVLGVLVPVLAPEAAAVDDDPKDEQCSHHTPRNARIQRHVHGGCGRDAACEPPREDPDLAHPGRKAREGSPGQRPRIWGDIAPRPAQPMFAASPSSSGSFPCCHGKQP